MSMSIDEATTLIDDRIKFKLYAADYYMKQAKGTSPKDPRGRIECEMMLENSLFHLYGALDALVIRINEKLQLGFTDPREITLETLYDKLKSRKKGEEYLLKDAHRLLHHKDGRARKKTWLAEVKEFRNSVTHRTILEFGLSATSKEFSIAGVHGGIRNTKKIEKSIQKMKKLITKIINKNPLLSKP